MPRFEVVSKYEGCPINLNPVRGTRGSVGYDLICAMDTLVPSNIAPSNPCHEEVKLEDVKARINHIEQGTNLKLTPTLVPTGVKAYCDNEYQYCSIKSRSGFPLKHLLLVANSEGVVDSDYADNPCNEGEMFVQFLNLSPYDIIISAGTKIAQAVFINTVPTDDDKYLDKDRVGGHGSTGL